MSDKRRYYNLLTFGEVCDISTIYSPFDFEVKKIVKWWLMSPLISFLFRIIQILISTQFSLKQWISNDPKQCFPIPLGHNKDRRLGSISRRDDTGFYEIILAFIRNLWISGRRRLTGRNLKFFFRVFSKTSDTEKLHFTFFHQKS